MTAKLRIGLVPRPVVDSVNDLIDRLDALETLVRGDDVAAHPVTQDVAADAAEAKPEPEKAARKTAAKKPAAPNAKVAE